MTHSASRDQVGVPCRTRHLDVLIRDLALCTIDMAVLGLPDASATHLISRILPTGRMKRDIELDERCLCDSDEAREAEAQGRARGDSQFDSVVAILASLVTIKTASSTENHLHSSCSSTVICTVVFLIAQSAAQASFSHRPSRS
jgi:hypothetical protein